MQGPIKFELTAAQVDTADTAAVSAVTLSDASGLVRIPVFLVICKDAGDAYTVSDDAKLCVMDEDDAMWFCAPVKGFLDQATQQSRACLAALSGHAFKTPNKTLSVRFTASVAKGTSSPNVKFAIYFEPIQLVW